MRWMHLTEPQLMTAVKETGLCVLPIGCLERHADHLPLGTDGIIAEQLAYEASLVEPFVVFPTYWYGQVHESTCFAGAVALPADLLVRVLQETVDAIARSGFKKILILNAHGGNMGFLDFIRMSQSSRPVDYTLYVSDMYHLMNQEEMAQSHAIWSSDEFGHACEAETSLYMACDPGRVDLSVIQHEEPVRALQRADAVDKARSGYWWYGKYPDHVVGQPSASTQEKGNREKNLLVSAIARICKNIKDDEATPMLREEFIQRSNQHQS